MAEAKIITYAQINACDHRILVPNHYRDDGTCRCDDATHDEMREWGYMWNGARWMIPYRDEP